MVWSEIGRETGGGEEDVPAISATNKASPMPIGAMNVSLLFSAASMRTVIIKRQVRNISINSPWTILVPVRKVVLTKLIGLGNIPSTRPAAAMAPRI